MSVIAVANLTPGQGRTTTALLLAAAIADTGQRVLLVDTTSNQTSRRSWLASDQPPSTTVTVDTPPQLQDSLPNLAAAAEHVVLDLPADQRMTRAGVLAADVVLVPLQPTLDQLDRLGPTVDLIAAADELYPRDLRVLFTRVPDRDHDGTVVTARVFLERLQIPVCPIEIPDSPHYQQAVRRLPAHPGVYQDVALQLQTDGRLAVS